MVIKQAEPSRSYDWLVIGGIAILAIFGVYYLNKSKSGGGTSSEKILVQYNYSGDVSNANLVNSELLSKGFAVSMKKTDTLLDTDLMAASTVIVIGGECVNDVFRDLAYSGIFKPLATDYQACCVDNLGCTKSNWIPNNDSIVLQVGQDPTGRKYIGLAGFSETGTNKTISEFISIVNTTGALPTVSKVV